MGEEISRLNFAKYRLERAKEDLEGACRKIFRRKIIRYKFNMH